MPQSLSVKLLASLAAAAVLPAAAAPYSQLIAFGDSLTDVGQLPDPGSPIVEVDGSPIPTAGLRLTNRTGPTYLPTELTGEIAIQRISRELGLGEMRASSPLLPGVLSGEFAGSSYARAGATSAEILASITEAGGATVSYGSLQTYRDGYLVEHGNADPEALYYINGGANDFLLSGVDDAAGTFQAADNLASGVDALHTAGARYIVVSNMPDLGATPLAWALGQSDPGAPEGLSQLSHGFNQTLYQQLEATDANLVILDTAGLLEHVISHPQQYGFAATNTCFDNSREGSQCEPDPTYSLTASTTPDPDMLIFNDDVHPTTRAQSIIADYALGVLQAPADVGILPSLGLELLHSDLQLQQAMGTSTRSLNTFGDWQPQFSVSHSDHTVNNNLYDTRYSGDSARFAVSLQRRMNKYWRTGSSLVLSRGEFQSQTSGSSANIENAGVSVFMHFDDNRYHSSGSLTYTAVRYADIYRHAPLGPQVDRIEEADTKGDALSFHLATFYDMSFSEGNWQYGPHIDIFGTTLEVDDYDEAGTSIAALSVEEQKWNSLKVNLAAYAQYLSDDKTLSISGKVGLMDEHGLDREEVGLSVRSLDTTSGYLPGYEASAHTAVAAQANITYSPNGLSRLSLMYHSVNGDDEQQSVALGMTLHF